MMHIISLCGIYRKGKAHLRPIRNEDEYDRTVILMNSLLDVVGDQDDHPLTGLLDLVSKLVEDFDTEHYAVE